MKSRAVLGFLVVLTISAHACYSSASIASNMSLPTPKLKGAVSLEESMANRRSVRNYSAAELTLDEVSQLLWAAQGITGPGGKRTAPSAGALYPLSIYLVAGKVRGLSSGIYRYDPHKHGLIKIKGGDLRKELSAAAMGQRWVGSAPVSLVFAVNYGRMNSYARKGKMYADIEQGHAAQNVLLQAVALGLGAVPVGAVRGNEARAILDIPAGYFAEYIISVGRAK